MTNKPNFLKFKNLHTIKKFKRYKLDYNPNNNNSVSLKVRPRYKPRLVRKKMSCTSMRMRTRTILLSNGCVHFEFYILKCKIFLIDFLDELGNFK